MRIWIQIAIRLRICFRSLCMYYIFFYGGQRQLKRWYVPSYHHFLWRIGDIDAITITSSSSSDMCSSLFCFGFPQYLKILLVGDVWCVSCTITNGWADFYYVTKGIW